MLLILLALEFYMISITLYIISCYMVFLLNIIFMRFIHIDACSNNLFLLLYTVQLYEYLILLMNTWIVSSF